MPIKPRFRERRTPADRVLSRCEWGTVCCWQPPNVYGLEIAAFLELHHGTPSKKPGQTYSPNAAAVRFAYRNHKPVMIRFTRVVSGGASNTVVFPYPQRRQLSLLPARANAVPYCEDIVPDSVLVRCEDLGDHLTAQLTFVAPSSFAEGSQAHDLPMRFPDKTHPQPCPCCP